MSFSSLTFLFGFLPVFFFFYLTVPGHSRTATLLIFSLLFYAWASPPGCAVLLILTISNYASSCAIRRTGRVAARKALLAAAVVLSVSALFYFKYLRFFLDFFLPRLGACAALPDAWFEPIYPMGLSFVVFHQISYAVEAFRGRSNEPHGLIPFALYTAAFPKLMQGPIVKWSDFRIGGMFEPSDSSRFHQGLTRFTVGLAKKILIADAAGRVADRIFALEPHTLAPWAAWLGALAYSFQIYLDFSGYMDMAIGLGDTIGLRLPENFRRPYLAVNFTDFWRRWHITLSAWFREYLYIPLGGNRTSTARTYLNLWIVFLISGLWHGANWTFIFWGFYHGSFLVADRIFWKRFSERLPRAVSVGLTFALVSVGWVFFRSASLGNAFDFVGRMFGLFHEAGVTDRRLADLAGSRELAVLACAAALSFFPDALWNRMRAAWKSSEHPILAGLARNALPAVLSALCVMEILDGGFASFLYQQF